MPTYTHIQFINHIFETSPSKKSVFGNRTYIGLTPAQDDIAARVAFVSQVLQKAKANNHVRHRDRTVLKVFMMPEFAFRGTTGAYTMDEAMSLIEKLQTLVKAQEWQDWLFIFGTVICKSYAAKKPEPSRFSKLKRNTNNQREQKYTDIDSDKKVEIYNIAPIQKGGFQDQPAHQFAHSVMKRYKSDADFIKQENRRKKGQFLVDEDVQPLGVEPVPQDFSNFSPPTDQDLSNEELNELKYRYIYGDPIFDQDGITFGLEICYDHGEKYLKSLLKQAKPALENENLQPKTVDVHLLTSCGQRLMSSSIVARQGYFSHSDGSLDREKISMNEVRKIAGADPDFEKVNIFKPILELIEPQDTPELSIPSVRIVKANKTKTIELNKLYPDGAGKFHIYGSLPLPPFENEDDDDTEVSESQSINLVNEFSIDDAESPVLLNGMKILFDQAVPTSPVSLVPKK